MDESTQIITEALGSLALYRRFYGSAEPYQKHKLEVAAMLDHVATNLDDKSPQGGNMLRAVAGGVRVM
jgi:hypothetical protein